MMEMENEQKDYWKGVYNERRYSGHQDPPCNEWMITAKEHLTNVHNKCKETVIIAEALITALGYQYYDKEYNGFLKEDVKEISDELRQLTRKGWDLHHHGRYSNTKTKEDWMEKVEEKVLFAELMLNDKYKSKLEHEIKNIIFQLSNIIYDDSSSEDEYDN